MYTIVVYLTGSLLPSSNLNIELCELTLLQYRN